MPQIDFVQWLGYLASALVFTAFYLKTIIPLRCVGIASNVTFIVFAYEKQVIPLLVLHCALLPLNILRLIQIRNLIAAVKSASTGDLSLEALAPMMARRKIPAGAQVFAKNDPALEIFFLLKGKLRVKELGANLKAGEVFGEMGIFTPDKLRTATVLCTEDAEIGAITESKIWELFYQNPRFGMYLMRIIVQRSAENISRI